MRLYCGTIDVLIDHRGRDRRDCDDCAARWIRTRRAAPKHLSVYGNRLGRADRSARRHHDAIGRKRDERRGGIGAPADVGDHRLLRRKQRVANAERGFDQAAGAVDVENDGLTPFSRLAKSTARSTRWAMPSSTVPSIGITTTGPEAAETPAHAKPNNPAREQPQCEPSAHVRKLHDVATYASGEDGTGSTEPSSSVTIWRTRFPSARPLSSGMTTFMTAPWLRASGGSSAKTLWTISRISSATSARADTPARISRSARSFVGQVLAAGLLELASANRRAA